jgi:hypothetical protein
VQPDRVSITPILLDGRRTVRVGGNLAGNGNGGAFHAAADISHDRAAEPSAGVRDPSLLRIQLVTGPVCPEILLDRNAVRHLQRIVFNSLGLADSTAGNW